MKRLFTFVITMLLGASLAFAQTGTGTTGDKNGPTDTGNKDKKATATTKKTTKTSKAHKGGKKSKKSTSDTTTTTTPK
jgi:hypothetical protein